MSKNNKVKLLESGLDVLLGGEAIDCLKSFCTGEDSTTADHGERNALVKYTNPVSHRLSNLSYSWQTSYVPADR